MSDSPIDIGWAAAQERFAVPDELHTRQAFMLGVLCGIQAGRIAIEQRSDHALDMARAHAMTFWREKIQNDLPAPSETP